MEQRDKDLLAIRPIIITEPTQDNLTHLFQDNVLRPILKLQNQLILFLFKNQLISQKMDWENFSNHKKAMLVEHTIKTNINLKELLKGIIIGCFTIKELVFWEQNKAEINKRIVQLLIKRIQSKLIHQP